MNYQKLGAAIGSAKGKKIDLSPVRFTNLSDDESLVITIEAGVEEYPSLQCRINESDWDDMEFGESYTLPNEGDYLEVRASVYNALPWLLQPLGSGTI